jgi:DNA-binding transcriptional ArsR family regulator
MEALNLETLRALEEVSPELLRALKEVPVEVIQALARVRPKDFVALREAQEDGRGRTLISHRQASEQKGNSAIEEAMKAATEAARTVVGYFVALTREDGQGGTSRSAWHSVRSEESAEGLLKLPDYKVAQVLSVLGSEVRLAMLRNMLWEPKTAAELVAQLQLGTTGQAYHHLRELERAGYIEQREGRYHFVEGFKSVYLIALALASDAGAGASEEAEVPAGA